MRFRKPPNDADITTGVYKWGGKVYRIYLGGSIGEIFPELGRARESARPQRRIASTSIITVIARCITMPWWLWLSPRDTCIVNTRLAALYDRRRCKVKCAWLRSALVYGICTSISMFRSYSRGGEGGGAALERTKRSANSQLASCCGSAYKDGWIQSHPRSCKRLKTMSPHPCLLSRWYIYF